MSELQILNNKQVANFVRYLLPILSAKFDAKAKELQKLAKANVNNFLEHEEVVEMKAKHAIRIEKAKKVIELNKVLKEIDPNWIIRDTKWCNYLVSTEIELEDLLKELSNDMNNLLIDLSEKQLNVNCEWMRKDRMADELKARLSVLSVGDFDAICEGILNTINIENYFNYPINN